MQEYNEKKSLLIWFQVPVIQNHEGDIVEQHTKRLATVVEKFASISFIPCSFVAKDTSKKKRRSMIQPPFPSSEPVSVFLNRWSWKTWSEDSERKYNYRVMNEHLVLLADSISQLIFQNLHEGELTRTVRSLLYKYRESILSSLSGKTLLYTSRFVLSPPLYLTPLLHSENNEESFYCSGCTGRWAECF